MTPAWVLDSWAVMAWLKNELPAAEKVQTLFDAASRREGKLAMNIVNLGEVYYLAAKARDTSYADRVLRSLRGRVSSVPAADDLVMYAAALKARYPISYADAFAAATAVMRNSPLVTGDRDFELMQSGEKGFQLEWIGQ
ncbi:MAG: PIN domain-containing protein [Acidobacteriota bacterium]|nr:PIN domain-containing protein [Acidobacteriota bacterium]